MRPELIAMWNLRDILSILFKRKLIVIVFFLTVVIGTLAVLKFTPPSYAAVAKDIEIVERYLLPGGWICFDDAFSSYDGVNEAIQKNIIDSGRYQCCQQITRKCFIAQRR